MRGTIEIRGLRITGRLGVTAEERQIAQALEVDLLLRYDIEAAARSDRIEDAVDYSAVARSVEKWAAAQESALVETMGVALSEHVLETWPQLEAVTVVLRKFPLAKAAAVELRIDRSRA